MFYVVACASVSLHFFFFLLHFPLSRCLSLPCFFSFPFLCVPIQPFWRPSPIVPLSPMFMCKKIGWIQKKKSGLLEFFLFSFYLFWTTGHGFPVQPSCSLPYFSFPHVCPATPIRRYLPSLIFIFYCYLIVPCCHVFFVLTSRTRALPCYHFCLLPRCRRCPVGLRYCQACYL